MASTAGTAPLEVSPEIAFRAALANPLVPKVYANHSYTVVQTADIAFMFGFAGQPTGVVSMPYAVAKAFALKLQEAIAGYEKSTGVSIPDVTAIENKLRASPVV
jgi:hypothetical protein